MVKVSGDRKIGLIGTLLGLLALAAAVFHFFLGPIEAPPPVEKSVADLAFKVKEAVEARMEERDYQPVAEARPMGPDRMLEIAIIAFAVLSIALGVFGFVQREDWRPSGAAVALGGAAIAFQFAVVIAGTLIIVLLVMVILSALGFG